MSYDGRGKCHIMVEIKDDIGKCSEMVEVLGHVMIEIKGQ